MNPAAERSREPESPVARLFAASPNFGRRAGSRRPDCLILHYTGMASAEAALAWLRDPRSQVSCHYFVWEDGRIDQLIAESERAWHAGLSFWAGERDVNSASIGVEIANGGHDFGSPPYPPAQVAAVVALCEDLTRRHAIRADRILAHSDVAPARKRDPGEAFPWRDLWAAGVGHWVEPAPLASDAGLRRGDRGASVAELQRALAGYGYEISATGLYDDSTEVVVRAFQRHFRQQRVDGVADRSTLTTLGRLIAERPVV